MLLAWLVCCPPLHTASTPHGRSDHCRCAKAGAQIIAHYQQQAAAAVDSGWLLDASKLTRAACSVSALASFFTAALRFTCRWPHIEF